MQLSPIQLLCMSFFWTKVEPELVSRQLEEGKDPQACHCMLVSETCCCSRLEHEILFFAGLGLQVPLSRYLVNSPSGNLLPDSSLQLVLPLQVVYWSISHQDLENSSLKASCPLSFLQDQNIWLSALCPRTNIWVGEFHPSLPFLSSHVQCLHTSCHPCALHT